MDVQIEPSWKQHLAPEFEKPYFVKLTNFVRQEYRTTTCYPPGKLIFNAFNLCPYDKAKVVIIGQDPYHGPGQLVCYPILNLEEFSLGLKEYVHLLEEAVIRVCASYGITAGRVEKATGVWLDGDSPRARKICAIGVRSSHYVTMHGLALNVNTDLRYFSYIHPCGFIDKGVTSLQKEL